MMRIAGLMAAGVLTFVPTILAAPPNVIMIYTDDQGAWTVDDAHPNLKTPNIDRIAREGANLTQSYATTPVCSPARASVMTSRYGTELGITDWINPTKEPEVGLDPSIVIWPKLLADAGYATALFGKWHLGTRDRYHPTKFGFQKFLGFRAGGNQPRDPMLEVDGREQKVPGFLTDILTDHVTRYIREHRDRPFLVCLHHRSPHAPYVPVPVSIWDRFKKLDPVLPVYPDLDVEPVGRLMREYLACVADIDRTVERILETLDETHLAGNTVVIFTSDQGYNVGHHGVLHKGNASWITLAKKNLPAGSPGVLRSNIFDTSLRVPTGIRWPGVIKPGTIIPRTITGLDWYPTLCAIAGTSPPAGQTIRGRNFLPLLRGEKIDWDDEMYAEYSQHHYRIADLRMWRTPTWKLVRDFHAPGHDELYDLTRDPDEANNLIDSADPQAKTAFEALNRKLLARMREINDPVLARVPTMPASR